MAHKNSFSRFKICPFSGYFEDWSKANCYCHRNWLSVTDGLFLKSNKSSFSQPGANAIKKVLKK